MGRSITPKYRMETRENIGSGVYSWDGRVSVKALERKVMGLNQSFLPGGVNEHVSRLHGIVPYISYARIVNQRTGETVAEWNAPAFQVL